MHILHVTPYYAPAYAFGGVPRAVEGMATALVQRGHQVTVLTTDAKNQHERMNQHHETCNGVQIVRVHNASVWLRGKANLSTPLGMKATAEAIIPDVDVIHCHEFRTVENLLVTPIAIKHHKPLVLSPHGTLPHGTGRSQLKMLWDRFISPSVARRFAAVVGLVEQESGDAQELWQQYGAHSDFYTTPNGVHLSEFASPPDDAAFRQAYGLGVSKVVLFMGRLHPRKGVDVLARAFKQLDMQDVKLVIAGPDEGLQADLLAIAADDERIMLTGYLDSQQRLAALSSASLLVLPAVGEGLPMSVLEAMAAGVPVIVSPGCNLPEVTQVGAGLEVPVDETALTTTMRAMLTNEELHRKMSIAARDLVRLRFTWDSVASQLATVYSAYVKS